MILVQFGTDRLEAKIPQRSYRAMVKPDNSAEEKTSSPRDGRAINDPAEVYTAALAAATETELKATP